MIMDKQLFTSTDTEWLTPQYIVTKVQKMLGTIDLDPCSNAHGEDANVPAEHHYTQEDDGLQQPWRGNVYMNPPHGRKVARWVDKFVEEYTAGNIPEAIVLVAARTDTQWFSKLTNINCMWCAVRGRLKFTTNGAEAKYSAPFPSAIVYFGQQKVKFFTAFAQLGTIYIPTRLQLAIYEDGL